MPIFDIQRNFRELGRIRLGDKGDKGQPQKLTKFRLTSASRKLLEAAATVYGGEVREWTTAPDEGYFELYTKTDQLDIILPPVFSDRDGKPTLPYSQFYELWGGGGCKRRCDGITELLSNKPCMCDADKRECKMTTRIQVMLPFIPDVGVWRVETHGYYAGTETTGTLELLRRAAEGQEFLPAIMRMEQRSVKREGEPTRRFVVPVVELPETRIAELVPGMQGAINAPMAASARPALPPAPSPASTPFENDHRADDLPGWGATPAPESFEGEDGITELTVKLTDLLVATDNAEAVEMIATHRERNDAAEHLGWLKRQIHRVEAKLAAGAA